MTRVGIEMEVTETQYTLRKIVSTESLTINEALLYLQLIQLGSISIHATTLQTSLTTRNGTGPDLEPDPDPYPMPELYGSGTGHWVQ